MKHWSKLTKYSLSIIMAVIISTAMMIPTYAIQSNPWIGLYYELQGVSNPSLQQITLNQEYFLSYDYRLGWIIYNSEKFLTDYTYNITVTIRKSNTAYGMYTATPYSLFLYNGRPNNYTNDLTLYELSTYNTITSENEITYNITFNSSDLPSTNYTHIIFACNDLQSELTDIEFVSAEATMVYDPEKDVLTQINEKIDDIIRNQNTINVNLTEIIENQIIQNNYIYEIINYGSEYNQIDSTLINNLGSAEDQLSNAEDALQNKSKSLVQRASGGVQQAVTASGQLVNSLTSTIPTVVSFTTDIIDQTPDEVQAAVLAVPLLSFAAWLIGLKK